MPATLQAKVWAAECPSPSEAVRVEVTVEALVIVPEISPVEALTDSPAGSDEAEYVSVAELAA
jgi:hypothetical protein